jgi:phosphoketolase
MTEVRRYPELCRLVAAGNTGRSSHKAVAVSLEFQLALDAIRRIPRLSDQVEKATARYWTSMDRHKLYIGEHGDDMPEVRDWCWRA